MAVIPFGNNNYQGLSSDTKPTNIPDGSVFYESDTYTFWRMVLGSWKELSQKQSYNYTIYKAGSILKAMNGSTGLVDLTHASDWGALVNSCISNMMSNGGIIYTDIGNYITNTVINVPKYNYSVTKPFIFDGVYGSVRDSGTQIQIGSSFPDQRYIFESVSTVGSNTTSNFTIKNMKFVNNLYAKTSTPGTNINGVGTTIDAGLVKFESDRTTSLGQTFSLDNVLTQYLWRGIHLLGYIFWPRIHNYFPNDFNSSFVGDFDIQMQINGHPDYPKGADMLNIGINHGFVAAGASGYMNAAINLSGGYHNIRKIYVDGTRYADCVIGFKQCYSSSIYGIQTIDLGATVDMPGTFRGVFVFDDNDPAGISPPSISYHTFNNQVYDISGSPVPYTITFANGAFRNIIRAYAYWGGNITINDAGAGAGNIVELIDGQQPSGVVNSKIISTNSLIKIIDKRVGADNKGLKIISGDGVTKSWSWNHGCFTTPTNYFAYPLTVDSAGAFDVTVSSTQITVTYAVAPPSGTNNLKWSWFTDIYS